jgi:hypothetical protein
MSFKSRLHKLEESPGSCPECANTPRPRLAAYYPEKGEEPPEPESCPACGRDLLIVFRVVYEDLEGEGAPSY